MLQQGPLWLELVAESFLLTSFDQPRIATSHFDGKLYAIQISFENSSRETLRGKKFRSCHKWRLELKKSYNSWSIIRIWEWVGDPDQYIMCPPMLLLHIDCNLILYVFKTLSIQPLRCYHFDSTVSQVSIKTMKSLTNDEHKNCKHLAKRYKTDNKHCTKNVEMFDKRSLQIAIWPG